MRYLGILIETKLLKMRSTSLVLLILSSLVSINFLVFHSGAVRGITIGFAEKNCLRWLLEEIQTIFLLVSF